MTSDNGNGAVTLKQFLEANPVQPGAVKASLASGGHVYFRKPTFAEMRALAIAQERGTPEQAARAEIEQMVRAWCADDAGTPVAHTPQDRAELVRRPLSAVEELMEAYASVVGGVDLEDESKN